MPYDAASQKLNLSAGLASVGVAAVLVVLKLWALWATGALSIAASLADSAMDLFVSAAGLAAIIYAARPADDDHTFGHSAIEDLVSLGQAIFVAASGGLILWVSTERLMSPSVPLAAEGAGIAVMAVSAGLTAALVLWQRRVARLTGNKVVAADMLHYVGDLLPTLGAILALGLSARFGWSRADSVIAIFAAALMLRGALQIGLASWHALMDRAAPADVVQGIAEIAAASPGVRGFHDLRTRTAGARIFVQLHIELDGAQSLEAAHAIARNLKRAIREAYPQADVIIHMDVWQG
ncbi:cation diffusion facilitator family transporter [Rhodobacter capsulatus]|uniref:Ferrous-iron efflux pump FieF n=1 Tax=Rhodobacter capsulatus TaxID=1061 RepID=A0A1G7FAC2_RHOCA|nr:cation diffusion facilitator family transporter [Rhodobacter capsulatus]WER09908.1 cation diffusion facilitator family transporter [Rhodobacter capsulatus]SDE72831.1 ferrous-iron efflux pump FieF [Rhodobacter capsulatus]